MNKKLIIIIAIGVIGIIRIVYFKYKNEEDNKTLNDFEEQFTEFCQSMSANNFDNNIYSILMRKSEEIQKLLGHYGIMATYQASRYDNIYRNYQVIVNELPKIRDNYSNISNMLSPKIILSCIEESINLITDSLLRKSGEMERLNNMYIKELKNPFIWLRSGIQFIITSPIIIVCWSGLIEYQVYVRITNNFFVRFMSFVIVMVELYGTVVTIVTGNQAFKKIISPYVQAVKSMYLSIFS